MYWKLYVSLLPHLLVCNTLARPIIYEAVEDDVAAVGSFIREIRQPAPLKVAAEVEDLMSAGNAPKSRDTKKSMKNASGTSLVSTFYYIRIYDNVIFKITQTLRTKLWENIKKVIYWILVCNNYDDENIDKNENIISKKEIYLFYNFFTYIFLHCIILFYFVYCILLFF